MPATATAITTDIILADLVGFSCLPDRQQLRAVEAIQDAFRMQVALVEAGARIRANEKVLALIPTGDGLYCIFHPALAGYGPLFALSIRNLLLATSRTAKMMTTGIHLVAHFGSAIPFQDLTGKRNYIGSGLNDCAHLLRAASSDPHCRKVLSANRAVIIASAPAFSRFRSLLSPAQNNIRSFLKEVKFTTTKVFSNQDKHGKTHRFRILDCSPSLSIIPPRPVAQQMRMVSPPSTTNVSPVI